MTVSRTPSRASIILKVVLVRCCQGVSHCRPTYFHYWSAFLVFLRTLPHNCVYNNIYCLFPFIIPEKSKEQIEKIQEHVQKKKYSFERPKQTRIKVLRDLEAISKVLNRPENFPTLYNQNLGELTEGYGWVPFDIFSSWPVANVIVATCLALMTWPCKFFTCFPRSSLYTYIYITQTWPRFDGGT